MITTESEAPQTTHAPHVGMENWRKTVDGEIDLLGWSTATRIEEPDNDVTIYVIDIINPEDKIFTPEGPATFSLSVFLDGAGTLSVDGAEPFAIASGSAVLFACKRTTKGKNTIIGGRRLHVVDMRFEPPLLEKLGGVSLAKLGGDLLSDYSRSDQEAFLIGIKGTPALLQVAADIAKCALPNGLARRLYLHSKAIECLSLMVSSISNYSSTNRLKPLNDDERRKLQAAVRFIETGYGMDWTTAKLAREVGLNQRRLKEGFRLAIGKSVHVYLKAVRLDAAATLLKEGMSVTEVAMAVGFDNLSHFSKTFRDHKGVSPSRING